MDQQHAWHAREGQLLAPDTYTHSIRGMHVYDSVIAFDKGVVVEPHHEKTGTPSFD